MAITVVTKKALTLNTAVILPTPAAVDAVAGASVTFDKADHKILLILTNAAAAVKTGKILKGNGLQGIADLDFSLGASETYCIVIESMKYVNVSGTNMGKLLITGEDANIKVSAVVLP